MEVSLLADMRSLSSINAVVRFMRTRTMFGQGIAGTARSSEAFHEGSATLTGYIKFRASLNTKYNVQSWALLTFFDNS